MAKAWEEGFAGEGVTIAVVDSGIDASLDEFAGRISPSSTDIYGQRDLGSVDDHGTRVALVAAGARDGEGIMGVAWESTILAVRTDRPGSCDGGSTSSCSFADSAIAEAVTHATNNGAKVINISLGGGSAGDVLTSAVSDAVARGVLVVVAAGNDGLDGATAFTSRISAAGEGGVLVVGSVNADNVLAESSNRAGLNPGNYIAARGTNVCCVYEDGSIYIDADGYGLSFSGTSFAAPQVSGAAALLAQAFPHLSGQQIAGILLESAFDAGAPGWDADYGRGILDIAAAFRPLGTTAVAGTGQAVNVAEVTGTGSSAMGDALSGKSLRTLVTDKYDRAFETDLGFGLRNARPVDRLLPALGSQVRHHALVTSAASLAFSIDASGGLGNGLRAGGLQLSEDDASGARVLAAQAAFNLSSDTSVGFAFARGADALIGQLQDREQPAFLIAPDASGADVASRSSDMAFAIRRQFGRLGVTASAGAGETRFGSHGRLDDETVALLPDEKATQFGLALDRRFGDADAALGLTWMAEDNTILGARFHDSFGLAGANTLFVDFRGGVDVAPDVRIGASVRQGFTRPLAGGLIANGSRLSSNAWSFDLSRRAVFDETDVIALRISQPLRVEGGHLGLELPQSWDYISLSATNSVQAISLAPEGREIMGEVAWNGRLFSGLAAASLFYRRDPGHYADLPDDAGIALRWSRDF